MSNSVDSVTDDGEEIPVPYMEIREDTAEVVCNRPTCAFNGRADVWFYTGYLNFKCPKCGIDQSHMVEADDQD